MFDYSGNTMAMVEQDNKNNQPDTIPLPPLIFFLFIVC
ncbi:hypothetical protein B4166_2996 [Caldibacillus thermoamylovorans]|nr:hypothetical protein B4166_2996 [Caldibacillus thermoamylovorans]